MLYDARKPRKNLKWTLLFLLYVQKNWKNILKILLFLIIFSILFFPTFSGGLIGNWIKDFFGTIINIIKTV